MSPVDERYEHDEMGGLLLDALALEWFDLDASKFDCELTVPTLELSDTRRQLGVWRPATRTLAISRPFALEAPWHAVLAVLAHEMAHQYVHEVLEVHDEGPHGPTFRRVCAERGIDASATGLPEDTPAPTTSDKVLLRVRRLLALARSDNRHEAEAAMRRAQRLLLEHNLDALDAGAPDAYRTITVGPVKSRFFAWERRLVALLDRHFFVEVVYVPLVDPRTGKRVRAVEISGTAANVDMAHYVEGFLRRTGEELWQAHKAEHGLTGNRHRQRFLFGVMQGFDEQLRAEREAAAETGLVWVGDPGLTDWLGRRYGRLVTTRGRSVVVDDNTDAGRKAGRRIVLRRPVVDRGTGTRGLIE